MKILPSRFYGDPAEVVDEMRKITEQTKRKDDRARIYKGQRIRSLVRQVMRGDKR